jgi:hypothetical protein
MKQGIVNAITQKEDWNGMQKWAVTMEDGETYQFLAKGNFKATIGETIKFEVTNETYKTAKLIRETSFSTGNFQRPTGNSDDKNISIIRQTCIKSACEFNAQRTGIDITNVIEDAEALFNWVTR